MWRSRLRRSWNEANSSRPTYGSVECIACVLLRSHAEPRCGGGTRGCAQIYRSMTSSCVMYIERFMRSEASSKGQDMTATTLKKKKKKKTTKKKRQTKQARSTLRGMYMANDYISNNGCQVQS